MQHQNDHTVENNFLSFRRGEERGFNYFFHLYYKPLVHFACSLLKDQRVAEDVVQDCFVKLWEKRSAINSASSLKPYLYTSVRNHCLDYFKHLEHRHKHEAYVKKSDPELEADVSVAFIASEAMSQLWLAVQNLPPKYKRLFNMLFVQGRGIKEIASELNLPLSTIRSQKIKTLDLLRKQLSHLSLFLVLFLLK